MVYADFIRPVCLPFVADYQLYGYPEQLEDAAVSLVAGWGKSSRRKWCRPYFYPKSERSGFKVIFDIFTGNHGSTVLHAVPTRIKSNQECSIPNVSKRSMTGSQVSSSCTFTLTHWISDKITHYNLF